MTEIGPILVGLGIDQYLDAFVGEGFDTWETVLDITESDLDALNVKLGHRRKLQREIANYRGVLYERSLDSPAHEAASDSSRAGESEAALNPASEERKASGGHDGKRKYRRHPKPDENAPDRPPSAYVIFSNKIREDVRSQNLSFTEIAKLVGENWQMLSPAQKEPFEAQAAAAKERYTTELARYKRMDSYKNYMQYLADFKLKHGSTATEGKRPKLEKESSTLSSASSAKQADSSESLTPMPRHHRGTSVGSTSHPSSLSSPSSTAPPFFGHASGQTPSHGISPSTDLPSPFLPPRGGFFNVPVVSRPASGGDLNSEIQTRNTQGGLSALRDTRDVAGYHAYLPVSAAEPTVQPIRPTMLPPPLLREDTTASRSSLSSGLSSGSTSSVPGLPHTPGDDTWTQRSNVGQGTLSHADSFQSPMDYPRPLHPPLTGSIGGYYPTLPQPRIPERGPEPSSPTAESQRIDTYLRSLPPPTVPQQSSISANEPNLRNILRSHASDPGAERLQMPPYTDSGPTSLPSASFTDPGDPLAVLAYAGRMLDEERRGPAPRQ